MFGSAFYLSMNPGILQRGCELLHEPLNETLPLGAVLGNQCSHALILFRLLVAEGQIFQFPLQLPDSQPVGQRRMDQHGLPGQDLTQLCVTTHPAQQHQFPGEINQHNPHVLYQRQQQPPEPFGAAFRAAQTAIGFIEFELVQFVQLLSQLGRKVFDDSVQIMPLLLSNVKHGAADGNGICRQAFQDNQQFMQAFTRNRFQQALLEQ